MTMLRRALCFVLIAMSGGIGANEGRATVLASDDFNAAGSGVGWMAGNEWEGLGGGVVSTNPTGTLNVQSFRDFATPVDASNGVTYIKVDYAQIAPGNGSDWGGLAFFTGTEAAAGTETLFIGNPAGPDFYGMDLKLDGAEVVSPVRIDDQFHTLIARIDTTGADDVYSFWVDNVNLSAPSATGTIVGGGPITGPWGTLRMASADPVTDNYDNLVIATTPEEVGLVPSTLTMTVDRSTGNVTLSSATPLTNVVGYSIVSAAGSLKPADWTPITGNYDSPGNGGNGSVDANDAWTILSTDPDVTTNLAEFSFSVSPGDGGTIGATAVNLGDVWTRSPFEDLYATVTIDDGGTPLMLAANTVYTGTSPAFGDLNGDGNVNAADWTLFKSGQGAVDGTLTAVAAYRLGDLNGDFDHTLADFDLFADAYDLANGAGAFVAMVQGVPEPSALALVLCGGLALVARRRRPIKVALSVLVAAAVLALGTDHAAHATVFAQDDFSAEGSGTGWAAGDTWGNVTNGVADTQFANAKFRAFATPVEPYLYDKIYIAFSIQFTDGNQWGGLAFFTGPDENNQGNETLFVGDPGQYSAYGLDMKQGGTLPATGGEGVAIDNAFHRMIVEIDFDDDFTAPYDDSYSLWIDSGDPDFPTHTVTIQDSPVTQAWQSVRLQSAGGGEYFKVDNFIITDEPDLVFSPTLNLLVDKSTGEISIRNTTGTAIDISGYSIESNSNMLNVGALPGDFDASGDVDGGDFLNWQRQFPTLDAGDLADWQSNFGGSGGGVGGWDSLADQNLAGFESGNGSGNGWEEGANPSPGEVAEYFLTGQSSVIPAAVLSLGDAYAGGAAGAEDLSFLYRSDGELKIGTISYVNGAAIGAVPEPTAVALAALACLGAAMTRRWRRFSVTS